MPVIKNLIFIVIITQIILSLISATNPVITEVTSMCTRSKQANNCLDCHKQKKYLNTKHKDQACYKCHLNISETNKVSYKACKECHKEAQIDIYPKVSEYSQKYCLECHDYSDNLPIGINWGHKIAGSSKGKYCSNCHRMHSDGKPKHKLLAQQSSNLCIQCHKRTYQDFMKTSSHLVQNSQTNCITCHNPHANLKIPPQHWQMDRGNLSIMLDYSINRQQDYCTRCHSTLILTSNYSSHFSNGMFSNLHDRHLKAGATCLECHNPHGSIYPHLIRTEVEVRSDFPIGNTLNYINIGSGGMCTVRCHGESHQGSVYHWTN